MWPVSEPEFSTAFIETGIVMSIGGSAPIPP
jgi:hypothetical protein